MPSGHPKDPVAYRQRMLEAKQRRDEKRAANLKEAKKLTEQGYSIAAIASHMNIPESSVRSLLSPTPRKNGTRKHTRKTTSTVRVTQKGTGRTTTVPTTEFFPIEESRLYKDLETELQLIKNDNVDLKVELETAQAQVELGRQRLEILFDLISGKNAQYHMNDLSQLR